MPIETIDEFSARLQAQSEAAKPSLPSGVPDGPAAPAKPQPDDFTRRLEASQVRRAAPPAAPAQPSGPSASADDFAKRIEASKLRGGASGGGGSGGGGPAEPEDSENTGVEAASPHDASAPAPAANPPTQGVSAPPPGNCAPAGEGAHDVRQGECISSIAAESGHRWSTIWDAPENAALRAARTDANQLLPGDRVHVPDREKKWEHGQTEARHRFQRHGETAYLPVRLMVNDQPLAGEAYTLVIDGGREQTGCTDAEGKLRVPISAAAKRARLVVGEDRREFLLDLGCMDPIESLAGVQKRLLNLGFDCGRVDGVWDDRSSHELRRFQRMSNLDDTGTPDDATRRKLVEVHGS